MRNCIIEASAWYMHRPQVTDAARNNKRTALRFVAHFVGDSHQPLHAGFAEDRGGNSVELRFNGRKMNLHSLSDTGLVELEDGTPADIAARIQAALTSDDVKQWQQGTAADWALESLAIVRAQVYRLPASGEINADYVESARLLIRTRLGAGGIPVGVCTKSYLTMTYLCLRFADVDLGSGDGFQILRSMARSRIRNAEDETTPFAFFQLVAFQYTESKHRRRTTLQEISWERNAIWLCWRTNSGH